MFKNKFIVLLFLLLILSLTSVMSQDINPRECRNECSAEKRISVKECRLDYSECKSECKEEKNICRNNAKEVKALCYDQCDAIEDRGEKGSCRKKCSSDYITERRGCNNECSGLCREDDRQCKDESKIIFDSCREQCSPRNRPEDLFNFSIGQEECEQNGGFYQTPCKGEYFRLQCIREEYCQCGGFNNFTCSDNQECVEDHNIDIPGRTRWNNGWVTRTGEKLGHMGVCGIPN